MSILRASEEETVIEFGLRHRWGANLRCVVDRKCQCGSARVWGILYPRCITTTPLTSSHQGGRSALLLDNFLANFPTSEIRVYLATCSPICILW